MCAVFLAAPPLQEIRRRAVFVRAYLGPCLLCSHAETWCL